MAELPLDAAVARFQSNEDRINKFVNAPEGEEFYQTEGGDQVPVLPKLLPAVTAQVERAKEQVQQAIAVRDSMVLDAAIADDIAAGLAATDPAGADEKPRYFRLFSPAAAESFIYYRHDIGGIATEVKRYSSEKAITDLIVSSADLFRTGESYFFPEANLPVRRYTSDSTFNDYAEGYSQTAQLAGLRVEIPSSGSGNIKHYLRTGKTPLTGAKIVARFDDVTSPSVSAAVGLGYLSESGAYTAYVLSVTGNFNQLDDFAGEIIATGLGTFGSGDSLRIEIETGVLKVYVNDNLRAQHQLTEVEFAGELIIGQFGFLNYTHSLVLGTDPIRKYVADEIAPVAESVSALAQSALSNQILQERATELFELTRNQLFPSAALPVRRYTEISTFTDYAAGYSQSALAEGLQVQVPASGSTAIKHYFLTGETNTAPKLVANFDLVYATPLSAVGIGYINSSGEYVAYSLSGSGVVRKSVGFSNSVLTAIIAPYETGSNLRYEVELGVLSIFLNGSGVHSIALDVGEFETELLIIQAGFPQYIVNFSYQSDPIRKYVKENTGQSPLGFYEFNGTNRWRAFTQVSGSTYVGFRIERQLDMADLVYVDYWRIFDAHFYTYNGKDMVNTGALAISSGESECVWKRSSNKIDFTGGVHGDELATSVLFFADGIALPTDVAVPLTPCSSFAYLEKSTMHETAENDGESDLFIPGHPIECYHTKRTEIKGGGYETLNRLTWETPGLVTLWYHGICCLGKPAATSAYTENNFVPEVFTGEGEAKLESVGDRQMFSWGAGYSALITSEQRQPATADGTATLFVSDRSSDSKYYRRSAPATVVQGEVWESSMKVIFSAR